MRLRSDTHSGAPTDVEVRGRWHAVARIEEVWRIDDGWWRLNPVRRTYMRVVLDDGRPLTLFQDQATGGNRGTGGWWQQRY